MLGQRRDVLVAACLAIMLSWSATSATAGHTYYVSADGNDEADGRTKKEAWRTLDASTDTPSPRAIGSSSKAACTTTAPSQLDPPAQRATSRSDHTERAAP